MGAVYASPYARTLETAALLAEPFRLDVRQRDGLREIITAHLEETVLVVSHKATLRLLLSSLLGIDPRG